METISLNDGRTVMVRGERWPIAGAFTISRGAKRAAEVVVVEISGAARGIGECVPYARYGESVAGVMAQIAEAARTLGGSLSRETLAQALPPGAARNALDCALWDYEAKAAGVPVHALAGLDVPRPVLTAYTIGLESPEAMAAKAAGCGHPLLKLKLGGEDDESRLRAVRTAAPDARLIVDANEGWRADGLAALLDMCAEAGVELVEQPLPASEDAALAKITRAVPVCADESAHDSAGLAGLRDRYDAVNIKLDKTGGLTEALTMRAAARQLGFSIMVGCMVGTSLAMAPALLVAQGADWVDLDGPLLLAEDRECALSVDGALLHPPSAALWG
ncbi:N-acetyl-D-Glu racemase DgcA [Dichotomicrobium thermohalophilum]|uniref:Dipeptide epimerase n=1 Tax=Dichotomicrobium thermohalophilum TaxID=933063 RepID=A0A397Q5X8_9HYPH|nr:N-acetyl-D-Glu racemase DgcA [Dichotomicrobium thermohalophilum]RIA55215.1 L-alanine-DL-glutamate epimerase-like enolase superfamily enzyme [Dichotomicrobium thermohalophilum]